MADSQTRIVLTAVDQTREAFSAVKNSLGQLEDKAVGLGPVFGALTAAMSFATLKSSIEGYIHVAASLDDMAEKTGASVEKLQGLTKVAKIAGEDISLVETALVRMTKALAGGDEESKSAGHALEVLGLSAAKLREMDPADALKALADRLNEFKDGAGKTALITDLLGKSGAQALPYLKDLAEAELSLGKITAEQAALAEQYEKNMKKLSGSFSDLGKTIAMEALPWLTRASEQMLEGIKIAGGFLPAVWEFGIKLDPGKSLAENLRLTREELDKLKASLAEDMEKNRLDGGSIDTSDTAKRIAELERRRDYLKVLQRQTALEGDPSGNMDPRDLRLANKSALSYTSPEKSGKAKKEKTLDPLDAQYGGYEGAYQDFVAGIKRAAENAANAAETDAAIEKERADRIKALVADTEAGKLEIKRQSMQEAVALMQEGAITEEQWLDYSSSKLKDWADKGKDQFSDLQRAIEGWGKHSADAIADFAMGGKASFGDMVNSMIRDLVRMVAYQNITKPLADNVASKTTSGGFWSSITSAVSGVFGGARAAGGDVTFGKTYLVGEQGPELFRPGSSGTIVPNSALGGGNVTVNVIESPGNGGKTQRRQEGGQNMIDVFVEQIKASIGSDIARGDGIVPAALESRYGLNRAPGGF